MRLHALFQLVLAAAVVAAGSNVFEELFGSERVQGDAALRCSSNGFASEHAKAVLDELLSKFKKHRAPDDAPGVTVYEDGKRFLVFGGGSSSDSSGLNAVPSDVAFVYAHHMTLLDEDATLRKMQAGLQAITSEGSGQGKSKKMLVLVVEGPTTAADYAKAVLEESWATLLDKGDEEQASDAMGQVVVHIVTVTGAVSDIAKDSVTQIVNDATLLARPLAAAMKAVEDGGSGRSNRAVAGAGAFAAAADVGMDACKEAVKAALLWARDGANASLQRLQRMEAAGEFAGFVERLVVGSVDKMKEVVRAKVPRGASATALQLAEQDVQRSVFTMLTPVFKRHVQLARQEAAKAFNADVGEELEVTATVMDDINAAKARAMRRFSSALRTLTPRGAPRSTWGSAFERAQLQASLDEYVAGRAEQFRLQGVLPRGRRPIEVSMHAFVNHPFGRDYRQYPLAAGDSPDEPFFDADGGRARAAALVHPSVARAVLESPAAKEAAKASAGGRGRTLTPRDSEFAREMLMFPMSIKNPAVPLMAGRSAKKANTAPPKKDPTRAALGPERFIRWDLPPLDEVRANLEDAIAEGTAEAPSVVSRALNAVPFFGRGFYQHPPVNYGPAYGASRKQQ